MLRSPDLRLHSVETQILRGAIPFQHPVEASDRGVFVFVLKGRFQLRLSDSRRPPIIILPGTAIGFEGGRAHSWHAVAETGDKDNDVALFISSIPRRQGVLQRLEDGLLIVPPDAQPHADILAHAVALHIAEFTSRHADDEAVIKRCAEICLIEMVRYTQSRIAAQAHVPVGLTHDEHLLRAWSAFFADPQRKWTVQALADAAGLGRTAFAQRFRSVFGKPPLHTLTELRLEQAESMLRHSSAPLIEIAFTVGYNSEAAFVRAFHRHFGTPPGRFRAQHGAAVNV